LDGAASLASRIGIVVCCAGDSARRAPGGARRLTGQPDLVLAAAIGAVCLALAASLWAVSAIRRAERRTAAASDRLARLEGLADATQASAEAFDSAMLTVEDGRAELAWGGDSLALAASVLGVPEERAQTEPQAVIDALMSGDPDHHRRLKALFETGQACAFEARGPGGSVVVDGRASGAVAWLRLQPSLPTDGRLPPAGRLAALLDALPQPVWLAHGAGLIWANRAWLGAVESPSVEDAIAR